MKKQLKEELTALAGKIALLKDAQEVSTGELKELAKQLYEKLTVLHFTESNMFSSEVKKEKEQEQPTVETAVKVEAAPKKEKKQESLEPDEFSPSGMEYNDDSEAITEPNTEKIKDIVAQMPAESQRIDELFDHVEPRNYKKNDMEDIGGVHYDNLPEFEPVNRNGQVEKPRSLNDRLKRGINIGVNDKLAFIKHLFDGSTTDYNRVLSQLSTLKTKEEAFNFVANMVKPDYNNWEGKEDYETRFLDIIAKKYE
ncbi:MAG: hypothetical protein WBL27_12245 [Salinimicrobium sp.]